jgi:hypothetical protein
METRKQDFMREKPVHFDEKPTPMPDFRQACMQEGPAPFLRRNADSSACRPSSD